MAERPNFKEPLRILNEERAEYLVVGDAGIHPRARCSASWMHAENGCGGGAIDKEIGGKVHSELAFTDGHSFAG